VLRVPSFCLTGHHTKLRRANAHALCRPRWRRRRTINSKAARQDAANTLKKSFHRKRHRARGRQRASWSAAPRGCAISSLRNVWETSARGARQSVFQLKTPTSVWSFYQLQALRSDTGPISDIFTKRGRKRRFVRNRFALDARRRRGAVARRRHAWRSIAHAASLSDSANRRRVCFPDAARLASIVCRQPPNKGCRDHSRPEPTRFIR